MNSRSIALFIDRIVLPSNYRRTRAARNEKDFLQRRKRKNLPHAFSMANDLFKVDSIEKDEGNRCTCQWEADLSSNMNVRHAHRTLNLSLGIFASERAEGIEFINHLNHSFSDEVDCVSCLCHARARFTSNIDYGPKGFSFKNQQLLHNRIDRRRKDRFTYWYPPADLRLEWIARFSVAYRVCRSHCRNRHFCADTRSDRWHRVALIVSSW